MFAVLSLERDPLRLEDVLPGLFNWVQTVGGFAMIGILAWLAVDWFRRRPADRDAVPRSMRRYVAICIGLALFAYALTLPFRLYEMFEFFFGSALYPSPNGGAVEVIWKPTIQLSQKTTIPGVPYFQSWCLVVGGLMSLAVVLTPFVQNLVTLRWRRIFALAGLSFKEAIRSRVLWAFSALLLVFLFGGWFISGRAKTDDQLRTYVWLVYSAMTPLLLVTSVLLAAFSIPADIRQQTIHTVLTKPVQRFEVYLGRILGFTGLMSLVLLVLSGISLLYVLRGVDPDAAAESLKARTPLFGTLTFENTDDPQKGVNVGEEWGYRSYVTAPIGGEPPQTAVFHFTDLPREFSQPKRKPVRCEFTFAVYRAYKGEKEARGIGCDFIFQTWRFDPDKLDEFRKERKKELNNPEKHRTEADVDDELAEKYGYYEVNNFPVKNFHTMARELPAGLFRNADPQDDKAKEDAKAWKKHLEDMRRPLPSPLEVRIRCLDKQEYVGMVRYDMYLRQDDSSDARAEALGFAVNFLKGSFGVWMRLVLVIGVATALSTYLSNVISLLVTMMLYIGGLCREFIYSVVIGKNVGGGPLQSFFAVVGRQVGVGATEQAPHVVYDKPSSWCVLFQHDTSNLEQNTSRYIFGAFDPIFRWVMGRVFDLIPDVDRFDLTMFVSEGFDVSLWQLFVTLLMLIGYLLPWAVLAFYLLKWREVASNT